MKQTKTVSSYTDFIQRRFTKNPDVVWNGIMDNRYLIEVYRNAELTVFDMNHSGKEVATKTIELHSYKPNPVDAHEWQTIALSIIDKDEDVV